MKSLKKIVSLLLVFTIVFSIVPTKKVLAADYKNHWANGVISEFLNEGVITTDSENNVKPNVAITRAEFVQLVNRVFDLEGTSTMTFTDVPTTSEYFEDISTAASLGYISGYTDGTFKPYAEISRQEAAVILTNTLGFETSDAPTTYADDAYIASWAKGSVRVLSDYGILNGFPDGTFKPNKNISRAEAYIMVDRASAFDVPEVDNTISESDVFKQTENYNMSLSYVFPETPTTIVVIAPTEGNEPKENYSVQSITGSNASDVALYRESSNDYIAVLDGRYTVNQLEIVIN
ncbi:MAG: S-layer homology domain-containing protein [Lachnospirales bacterium]